MRGKWAVLEGQAGRGPRRCRSHRRYSPCRCAAVPHSSWKSNRPAFTLKPDTEGDADVVHRIRITAGPAVVPCPSVPSGCRSYHVSSSCACGRGPEIGQSGEYEGGPALAVLVLGRGISGSSPQQAGEFEQSCPEMQVAQQLQGVVGVASHRPAACPSRPCKPKRHSGR